VQFPIIIGLHRSRFLDGVLIVVTLLAIGTAVALPYSAIVRLVIALLIVVGSYDAWRKLKPTLSGLRLDRSGQIFISEAGDTEFLEAELLPCATVHPWLTVVRVRVLSGRRHTLIAVADSMRADDFRRLRVFLRWHAKSSPLIDDV
jgi:toxin CptA